MQIGSYLAVTHQWTYDILPAPTDGDCAPGWSSLSLRHCGCSSDAFAPKTKRSIAIANPSSKLEVVT